MALLEIDCVRVVYGAVEALREVSMTAEAGSITAVMGPNGAGKSTCLKAVSGIVTPLAGRIMFDGVPITDLPARKRVALGIAHVLEGRRLFTDQTVEDNLALGAFSRRGDSAEAIKADRERLLKRFPILAERRHQRALTLSGGEQQMLAIASALISRPRLLLLDEPSLGLAPKIVEELARLIVSLRDEGMTILLVEQMASLALAIAERGYFLDRGGVVLSGSSAELRANMALHELYLGKG